MATKMTLKDCKKNLIRNANTSVKNGYTIDGTNAMFKVYVLELVERVALALEKPKRKRKPSKYNDFFARKAKEGMSSTQIGKLWKELQ